MNELQALCDAVIFTGEAFVEGHALIVRGGKILDIAARSRVPADAIKISCKDQIIAPGFIDAQVNGGGNLFFNNDPSAKTGLAIASAHRKYGTTRLLLTCISDKPEITRKAVSASRDARQRDASILGIHLEGPHLSIERRGVHKAEFIRHLTSEDFALYHRAATEVLLITVAPESASPAEIRKLRQQGVIVAIGHTAASAQAIKDCLQAGATGFTHLFNGMGGLMAREPGPAGIALDDRGSWCSLLVDGFHVAPEMVRLALRAKPSGKVFLVSDAMAPSASETPLPFELYGEKIMVDNGRLKNSQGKHAGSMLTMSSAVRNCIQKFGIDAGTALSMATAVPAAFLGLSMNYGKLLPGFEADIIALDAEWNVTSVWTSGLKR